MPPVRSSITFARKRPRHLEGESDDSEVYNELDLGVRSDPIPPSSYMFPTTLMSQDSNEPFHKDFRTSNYSTRSGADRHNENTQRNPHIMFDPTAAESSVSRAKSDHTLGDRGSPQKRVSAEGRKRNREISDSSVEGGYMADRCGMAEDKEVAPGFERASSSRRIIHTLTTPSKNDKLKESSNNFKSAKPAASRTASSKEPTSKHNKLQALEIILRRYGGDAPSRPLTSTKSTPLPTSQRLRLTASAQRRPIAEENPFNPARVSRRGVTSSTVMSTTDDGRQPSTPTERTLTMMSDGSREHPSIPHERRSPQVRPYISASQHRDYPLYRTTSMLSSSTPSSRNASQSGPAFSTPLSQRSESNSQSGLAPARRRSRTNSMMQVPGLVRTNSQIGILQRTGSMPIASRERSRNALGDVAANNPSFNGQGRAGAFLTASFPNRTTGQVEANALGRTKSVGGPVDKLNQTEEDKLAADLQAMALARKFHTPSPFEIADPRSIDRICHQDVVGGETFAIHSSPYSTTQSRDYRLDPRPSVPGPRSPTSPSAPYSLSSPRSDRFRSDHRGLGEIKKRYITHPRGTITNPKNVARQMKTELIGRGVPTNRRSRPGLTRQKAMSDLRPSSWVGSVGLSGGDEEDVAMLE